MMVVVPPLLENIFAIEKIESDIAMKVWHEVKYTSCFDIKVS